MSPSNLISVERPDDVATIRFLSSVLSSLNDKVILRTPTANPNASDVDLQFFNHLATMFDTGSHEGLGIAVTGKFDEEGPMVTIVVSRNSSRNDVMTEPNQPDASQSLRSESLGFRVLNLPPSSITVDEIHREIA